MDVVTNQQVNDLYETIKRLYAGRDELLFHGWHHVEFVYQKSKLFAEDLKADINLTQSAALVHDLNYLANPTTYSDVSAGKDLRQELLAQCDYDLCIMTEIEKIVIGADISNRRNKNLSPETKALSDADTLFKALPIITPVFTGRFIAETNMPLSRLADKIIRDQKPLLEGGIYFYSALGNEKYLKWAEINLALWDEIQKCLDDDDIRNLLTAIDHKTD